MKNLNKKIGVVVLSGLVLAGGSLVAGSSVAHADSLEEYYLNNMGQSYARVIDSIGKDHFGIRVVSFNYKDESESFFRKEFNYDGKIEKLGHFYDPHEVMENISDVGISKGLNLVEIGSVKLLLIANKNIAPGQVSNWWF